MRRHAHDRARPVRGEHVVGDPDRHARAAQRIDAVSAGKDAGLFLGRGQPLDVAGFGRFGLVRFDRGAAFGLRYGIHQRMLGREHHVADAEQRIGAGGEHAERAAALYVKFDFAALAFADPVFLHQLGLFRPVEAGEAVEELLRVLGDFEKPLVHFPADDLRAAPFAAAVHYLFVGDDGVAGRAPVDRRQLLIRQPLFVQLQEQPLRPLIIFGRAGVQLMIPVEHGAHGFQLHFHGGDVFHRRVFGMYARLDGIVLRRQPERVEPHRLKDVIAVHFHETGVRIGQSEIVPVPQMQVGAGRVGEHFQHVVLLSLCLRVELVDAVLLPVRLPLFFNGAIIHNPSSAYTPLIIPYRGLLVNRYA